MSLADAIAAAAQSLPGECAASHVGPQLEDPAAFAAALADPAVLPDVLAAAVAQLGVLVAADAIRTHRGGACLCYNPKG